MEIRENIELHHSLIDLIVLMGEGNMGGLSVAAKLAYTGENGTFMLLHLDDMNIRGTQIWIAFKDYCKENMEEFIKCIKARDAAMIEKVNEVGLLNECLWKAVEIGASARGARQQFTKEDQEAAIERFKQKMKERQNVESS
jgi:hypothetical protein